MENTWKKRKRLYCQNCGQLTRVKYKPQKVCLNCKGSTFVDRINNKVYHVAEDSKPKLTKPDLTIGLKCAFDTASDDLNKMYQSIDNLIMYLSNENGISDETKLKTIDKYEKISVDIRQIIESLKEYDNTIIQAKILSSKEIAQREKLKLIIDCSVVER